MKRESWGGEEQGRLRSGLSGTGEADAVVHGRSARRGGDGTPRRTHSVGNAPGSGLTPSKASWIPLAKAPRRHSSTKGAVMSSARVIQTAVARCAKMRRARDDLRWVLHGGSRYEAASRIPEGLPPDAASYSSSSCVRST